MNIFDTKVLRIGSEAKDFLGDGLIILFGEKVPSELENFCFIINVANVSENLEPGMRLVFGVNDYLITAVGSDAQANLENLGHITINFDGSNHAELPGTIYVESKTAPSIEIGDSISIIK